VNTYVSGSLVRTIATFTNIDGDLANPSDVVLKYQAGSGNVQTPAPVNDSAGVYHYDIDTTGWTNPNPATYTLEWIGTGAVQAIGTDQFSVQAAPL
jgi:hypothetical protein